MPADVSEILVYTVPEVAERLRVSKDTVYGMIDRGTLSALRTVPGGRFLIPKSALAEFLAGNTQQAS